MLGERDIPQGIQSETSISTVSRRRFLSSIAAASTVLIACGSPKPEEPTVWTDPDLKDKPDRGLTSLMLRFDSQHDPSGSVRVEVCFNNIGRFRVVSQEVNPRPGYLVDKTFPHQAICYPQIWPVSPIDRGDVEIVYISSGDNNDPLTDARAYEVRRVGSVTLDIKSLGAKSLGTPNTLPMRDAPTHS